VRSINRFPGRDYSKGLHLVTFSARGIA
jgi:hypothetical protein